MIHLGYETGTGKAVGIPLAHMAVTGQTQQSGKTTTLEALIDRGDLRAVVFVTKPGEKSFSEGRRILPYFKERADWEYVKELLESRRNESLSKWDGYLMRVCQRARTLQDVRNNVAGELPKKKSARPSHYEVLAGYLDLIIPELDRIPYTDKLDLRTGVNIMDLTEMSDEMQALVLRSTIERIHKSERGTVLVLPEAWKFIPEGGRSSVFQALHALIREGATNGNFVWIDAQDLAIVSKRILKSVTVWVLGKQQEANEVARTINHLIEPLHIRADMIKSLGIGQFLVCGEGVTKRVYVQPRWLGELDALAIARGEESVETAQAIWRQKVKEAKRQQSAIVVHDGSTAAGKTSDLPLLVTRTQGGKEHGKKNEAPSPQSDNETVTGTNQRHEVQSGDEPFSPGNDASGRVFDAVEGDEKMWKEKYEALQESFLHLERALTRLQDLYETETGKTARLFPESPIKEAPKNGSEKATQEISAVALSGSANLYADMYKYVVDRAREDLGILQLLSSRPELRVQIERPVLEVDGKTVRGGLALLIHKGFFGAPKNGNTTFNELQRLGRKTAKPNVYRELDNLVKLGFLTKEPDGYQATELKVTVGK